MLSFEKCVTKLRSVEYVKAIDFCFPSIPLSKWNISGSVKIPTTNWHGNEWFRINTCVYTTFRGPFKSANVFFSTFQIHTLISNQTHQTKSQNESNGTFVHFNAFDAHSFELSMGWACRFCVSMNRESKCEIIALSSLQPKKNDRGKEWKKNKNNNNMKNV